MDREDRWIDRNQKRKEEESVQRKDIRETDKVT